MLLDYILELNKKGYCVSSKPNSIFHGIDITVNKYDLFSRQSIPFDTFDEVNLDKEDMLKIIIEDLVRKIDERSKND